MQVSDNALGTAVPVLTLTPKNAEQFRQRIVSDVRLLLSKGTDNCIYITSKGAVDLAPTYVRRAEILDGIIQKLSEGAIVLWEPAIVQTAQAGADAFNNVRLTEEMCHKYSVQVPPVFLCDVGFMIALSEPGDGVDPNRGIALAFVVTPVVENERFVGMAVACVLYASEAAEKPHYVGLRVVFTTHAIGDVFAPRSVGPMCEFLTLPFVHVEQDLPSRQVIRQYVRKAKRAYPVVRTITLRRASTGSTATTSESVPGKRHVSQQFVVNGFWRNQACGVGWRDHKVVWVEPFMKGPKDAPVKTPTKIVYRANR
jgi:hypothetical protein